MSSWFNLACSGDMYSSVPTSWPRAVKIVFSVSCCPDRLGHAKVDDLADRPLVVFGHQHIGRLEVAMDDSLLMGVLNRLADRHKQFQPLLEA